MDHIGKTAVSLTPSMSSMQLPTKPSADRVDLARVVASRILKNYPDYGKASAEYTIAFAESLSYLTTEEMAMISNPIDGIHTASRYMPTAADVHEFLRKKREPLEKYKAFGKPRNPLPPDPDPEPDAAERERRKAFVINTRKGTGFDVPEPAVKRDLVPPTAADLANLKLKTPPAPASEELKRLLWTQGYFTQTEKDIA